MQMKKPKRLHYLAFLLYADLPGLSNHTLEYAVVASFGYSKPQTIF